MKLLRAADKHMEEYMMGILLIGIAVIMFIQIIMRTMSMSLAWAEEAARYFYVWSVFLSLGCSIRLKIILRVDLLLQLMPAALQKALNLALEIVNSVLFAYLLYYSISVVNGVKASSQTSPALAIPMYMVYWIVPIGFLLASLRSVQQIVFLLTGKGGDAVDIDPSAAAS